MNYGAANFTRNTEKADLAEITTVFWDIGGVIMTNGWDRNSRREAADRFHLDWEDFQDRHELTFPAFETGHCTLDEYLERTIFHRARSFTRAEFTTFMFAQSKEYPQSRAVLGEVVRAGKYLIGAINNEPLELNQHRIEAFHLRREFLVFFSSCYVGSRKPDEAIFRFALLVTQRPAEECLFIDDRPLNLECPKRLGLKTIHYQSAEQLRVELERHGVKMARG